MSGRILSVLLLSSLFTMAAFAMPSKHRDRAAAARLKEIRHDPAFRAGYDNGYRQGANDSQSLSLVYKDEMGPLYDQANDGYTPQYGDLAAYQKLFREGYVAGYKAGWDFNAGQYTPFGAGGGGP